MKTCPHCHAQYEEHLAACPACAFAPAQPPHAQAQGQPPYEPAQGRPPYEPPYAQAPFGPPPQYQPPAPPYMDPADVQQHRLLAVLAYLGPLVFVPLLEAKASPYARFHTNQGIALWAAAMLFWLVVVPACFLLALIPFVGTALAGLLVLTGGVTLLVLTIQGLLAAWRGEIKVLSLVGKYQIIHI